MADRRIRSFAADEAGAAVRVVLDELTGPALAVIKGSRGARMKRVVSGLVEALGRRRPGAAAVG